MDLESNEQLFLELFLSSSRREALVQLSGLGSLASGAAALLPGTMISPSGALAAPAGNPPRATADACLFIFLDGGASQIDLLDLKPQAPLEIRGPHLPIDTSVPGIQVGDLLPLTARQMHHVTLLRSLQHAATVHDPAVYQMLTGYRHLSSAGGLKVEETDLPHLGCAVGAADRRPAAMPKVIELPDVMKMDGRVLPGQNAGILGATFDPFRVEVSPECDVTIPPFAPLEGIDPARLAQRAALLDRLESDPQARSKILRQEERGAQRFLEYQQQALQIVNTPRIREAFDLSREPEKMRDAYGRHRHGQSVLLGRRLIEAGARFVTVYWGNEPQDWADGKGPRPTNNPWDTHRNHFPLIKNSLLPRADRALATLLADMAERGLLERTLVVWSGEFGRTPRISKPWASRDHWPQAYSAIVAGGGLKAGELYGATDARAEEVTTPPVSPADFTATIFSALGIDPTQSLPTPRHGEHRLSSGSVVEGLFA